MPEASHPEPSHQLDPSGDPAKQVSFVIPCFNEDPQILSQTIAGLRAAVNAIPSVEFEVVVVDDGSVGQDYAAFIADPGLRWIRHRKNRGYGASLATGIRRARYDWIGIIDADGTYPSGCFASLIPHTGHSEMVIAARQWRDISPFRRPAKIALTLLASYLANYRIPDLNSGMRIFHRQIYENNWRIFPDRFSFSSTLTMAALVRFHEVEFVAIPYLKRVGKSSISPVRDTIRFLYQLLRLSLYFRPLRFFMPLSGLAFVGAIARGTRDYLIQGSLGGVSLILFFMAFQIFFFGLIAEIVNKK